MTKEFSRFTPSAWTRRLIVSIVVGSAAAAVTANVALQERLPREALAEPVPAVVPLPPARPSCRTRPSGAMARPVAASAVSAGPFRALGRQGARRRCRYCGRAASHVLKLVPRVRGRHARSREPSELVSKGWRAPQCTGWMPCTNRRIRRTTMHRTPRRQRNGASSSDALFASLYHELHRLARREAARAGRRRRRSARPRCCTRPISTWPSATRGVSRTAARFIAYAARAMRGAHHRLRARAGRRRSAAADSTSPRSTPRSPRPVAEAESWREIGDALDELAPSTPRSPSSWT